MADYLDSAIQFSNQAKKEKDALIEQVKEEAVLEALNIVKEELAKAGNPYTVKLYKTKTGDYQIIPDDQDAAFKIEIGGEFSEPGSSFTEGEKNEVLRRAMQKINRLFSSYASQGGIQMRATYTIDNPTAR